MHDYGRVERPHDVRAVAQLPELAVPPRAHFLLDAHAHADALDPAPPLLLVGSTQSKSATKRLDVERVQLVLVLDVAHERDVADVYLLVAALRVSEGGEVVQLAVLQHKPAEVHPAFVVPALLEVAFAHAVRELLDEKQLFVKILFHVAGHGLTFENKR